jgi:uncharacterized protein (DUF488 family)
MRSSPALFTFGYEGLDIDRFIERLNEAQVKLVVDVRELPLSRKKGFSKSSFREQLSFAGIAYEHWSALGCPRSVRDAYKANGDWTEYTRGFLAHLISVQTEVQALARLAKAQRVCLVCFEADFEACHRTYVARAARRLGAPAVQHITAKTVVADAPASLVA